MSVVREEWLEWIAAKLSIYSAPQSLPVCSCSTPNNTQAHPTTRCASLSSNFKCDPYEILLNALKTLKWKLIIWNCKKIRVVIYIYIFIRITEYENKTKMVQNAFHFKSLKYCMYHLYLYLYLCIELAVKTEESGQFEKRKIRFCRELGTPVPRWCESTVYAGSCRRMYGQCCEEGRNR